MDRSKLLRNLKGGLYDSTDKNKEGPANSLYGSHDVLVGGGVPGRGLWNDGQIKKGEP